MKGPRSRHKFVILRIWECPACQRRVQAPVQVVNRECLCQGVDRPTWMRLIEESAKAFKPDAEKPPKAVS